MSQQLREISVDFFAVTIAKSSSASDDRYGMGRRCLCSELKTSGSKLINRQDMVNNNKHFKDKVT